MRKLLLPRRVRAPDGKSSATIGTPAEKTAICAGLGITVLAEPTVLSEAVVEYEVPVLMFCYLTNLVILGSIVLVHGLQGGSDRTWLHEESGVYWPVDFLSHDIPCARILAFGYDAEVVNLRGPASQNRISNHATNLLGDLSRLRENTATVCYHRRLWRLIILTHTLRRVEKSSSSPIALVG
jgi:hypothetical protein